MVIRGGSGVGEIEGVLEIEGVADGVKVWSSVGDGMTVTGLFTLRVTSEISVGVASLVTSTVWIMRVGLADWPAGAQEATIAISRHADKQSTMNLNSFLQSCIFVISQKYHGSLYPVHRSKDAHNAE